MTIEKMKEKMIAFRDIYGGELINVDEVKYIVT